MANPKRKRISKKEFLLTWWRGKRLGLPYRTCAPSALIGASNFFELAVAVAIMLFGLDSGAALTTVVGVLIEVPIMLSLDGISKKWSGMEVKGEGG